jgi:hypothetical protein
MAREGTTIPYALSPSRRADAILHEVYRCAHVGELANMRYTTSGVLGLFAFTMTTFVHAETPMTSAPVTLAGRDATAEQGLDEKGNKTLAKPLLFSVFLGNRFTLPSTTSIEAATDFATTNIIRSNETIYKGSGVTLNDVRSPVGFEPTLRIEWEIPFERTKFLPSWGAASLLLSLEGGLTTSRDMLASSGNFRYQNAQANHVALTDLTYTGSLKVSEKSYNLMPMLGLGFEYTNSWLKKLNELRLLLRVSGGIALQAASRKYELNLDPQAVSAGVYSDTYAVSSTIIQSYSMGLLPAARGEVGFRMRVGAHMHASLTGSFTFVYGVAPYDSVGYFEERAGGTKTIYQKIVSSTADEDYMGLIPAVFLALSMEI